MSDATTLAAALADAVAQDDAGTLPLRDSFRLPPGLTYLAGNSLGAPPVQAFARLAAVAEAEWGEGLVRSWNTAGWWQRPLALGDRLGALLGAAPGQVAVCDSISVNLAKLLVAALRLRPGRTVIVTQAENFPTDIYAAEGVAALLPGTAIRFWDGVAPLGSLLGPDVAVVMLSHVDYRTAEVLDAAAITAEIQAAGALALWDLAHSAGPVAVALDGWGADMAVGCTYKYLNAGPGGPAYLYVAARHQDACAQPLTGWIGHARPFAFEPGYEPHPGIRRFLAGTPPLLAYAPLEASLGLLESVPAAALLARTRDLTGHLIALADRHLPELELRSPRDPLRRGGHVAFAHRDAYALMRRLIAGGVIGDFRAPDLVRFGFSPLYNTRADAVRAVAALRAALDHPVEVAAPAQLVT